MVLLVSVGRRSPHSDRSVERAARRIDTLDEKFRNFLLRPRRGRLGRAGPVAAAGTVAAPGLPP